MARSPLIRWAYGRRRHRQHPSVGRKGRGLYAFDGDGQLLWSHDLGASVWGLALAADGRTVAVGTDGRETLIFDDRGHLLWQRETSGIGWWAWVWTASLSVDGQTIAIGAADKTVTVLDRGGNMPGQHRADADVFVTTVSADGQTIAAGSSDQRVYLLDRQGNLLWSEKLEDKVWAVALPADGQRLIVGAGEKEGHVRTFDREGQPLWKRYVEGGISSVDISTGGDIIEVATRAGQICLFDGGGEPIHQHMAQKNVRNVAVSASGQVTAAVSEDGQVYGFLLRHEPSMSAYMSPAKGNGETPDAEPPLGIGNRWAVLAGVDEYQDDANYGQLQTCVKDAAAIREQLAASGFDPSRVRLLISNAGQPPTKANILVVLKAVADAIEPDDLLLFYYNGHSDKHGDESYLVARDGRRLVLADTAVPLSRVREIVQEAPARAKVIVLDACHSGADIGGKGPKKMSAEFIRRVFEEAEGLAVLASCKKGQLSYEWRDPGPGQGRSVFTHFFLEALTGEADRDDKGFVTVQDTSRYVSNGVKLWASQRNLSQTPTLQYTVAGDIILVSVQGGQETNDD
ncbi:MAG: PQQ-binding-like beta-propeller repeat protein [Chloroflexi bacterium]|nr:PQQ-binding-like beta-propeller repeat protein [Chloroflexota bacterium]